MTTKTLRISDDLALPLDAVTRRLAILAMSGAGKSNVAVSLAEQMHDAGIPWVAIDPKGDWWGIRSSSDGKGPGLPIPIFGGLHGDVPLEPRAGKYIANLIMEQCLTCVLDVSEFDDRQEMWGFLADLGETLLRRNTDPRHLFLEEADEYIPQSAKDGGNLKRCLGVYQRVVKKGRTHALGCTQITQRSATLNKDTLYQAEVMIALRATGKGDRKAVEGWVDHHSAAGDVVASLPTLADGEGWVSSPAWLRTTQRVHFNRRRTFDSGATPVLAKGPKRPPATLADVDLVKLRSEMKDTIERAKADDPKELRKAVADRDRRIRELEAKAAVSTDELARAKASTKTETKVKEVPALSAKDRAALEQCVKRLEAIVEQSQSAANAITASADAAREPARQSNALLVELRKVLHPPTPLPSSVTMRPVPGPRPATPPRPVSPSSNGHAEAGELSKGEIGLLVATAQHTDGVTREQLSVLLGFKRSYRDLLIQKLRRAALIEDGERAGRIVITDAGRAALPAGYEPLPTGDALRSHWLQKLPEGEAQVLGIVCNSHPNAVARDAIDEATGFKRSYRDLLIQKLARRRLVSTSREGVTASAELFD